MRLRGAANFGRRPGRAQGVGSARAWSLLGALRRSLAGTAVVLLAGCSASAPPPLTAQAPPQVATVEPAPAPKPAGPVRVALLVPLSALGPAGTIGKSLRQAAELALSERDSPSVELLIKDDKGTPEGARIAVDEALREGAGLILGPLFAKSVSAVAPAARAANVPVVAFSNDRQVAGNGVYLLGYQPGPEVQRIVAYVAEQGKTRFVAMISDDAFGRLVTPSFNDAVAKAQGQVIALETYPMSANAMLEPLRKIATVIEAAEAEKPIDVLFLPGSQEHLDLIGRLLPQANIDTSKIKIIGTGGMDYPNAGRDQRLVGAWFPAPDPAGWTDFSQKFAKANGQAPPRIAALAFDGVSLAIALAGTHAQTPFSRETLTRASGFPGVDGTFRLTTDGACERPLAILEVKKFGASVVQPAAGLGAAPAPRPSTN